MQEKLPRAKTPGSEAGSASYQQKSQRHDTASQSSRAASVSRGELLRRLERDEPDLVVTPMPAPEAIGKGSIDLRLSTYFLSARRSSTGHVSPDNDLSAAELFHHERVRPGSSTVIHPGQFVLAATLEYICLPQDLCGIIESRSSFGRMGLVAATATWVGPGYRGCPTLEIVNLGELPISIRPYVAPCQIIILSANEDDPDPSRYQCTVRPHYMRPKRDEFVDAWGS